MSTANDSNKVITEPPKPETTYFGLEVVITKAGKVVRFSDIERLPFFDFWLDSQKGSAMLMLNDQDRGVYLHDWIAFSRLFIQTGKHRYLRD